MGGTWPSLSRRTTVIEFVGQVGQDAQRVKGQVDAHAVLKKHKEDVAFQTVLGEIVLLEDDQVAEGGNPGLIFHVGAGIGRKADHVVILEEIPGCIGVGPRAVHGHGADIVAAAGKVEDLGEYLCFAAHGGPRILGESTLLYLLVDLEYYLIFFIQ